MDKFLEALPVVVNALNEGFLQTLKLFGITLLGALPLGLLIAFGSMSRLAPLSRPIHWWFRRQNQRAAEQQKPERAPGKIARALIAFQPIRMLFRLVVWVIRGTPLMLQLFIIFYIPGYVLDGGSPWPSGEPGRFLAAAVAFIINYACYFSVIYRGGIEGVPVGQQEAGQVLGMTRGQIFRHVTLLQMVKRIVPPMSNEIITLVKDTSIARIISFQEIIWAGYSFLKGSHGYSGLVWPLFFTGLYLLAFNGLLSLLFGWVEKKLSYFQ